MRNLKKITFNKISKLILVQYIKSKIKIYPETRLVIPRGGENLDYIFNYCFFFNTLLDEIIIFINLIQLVVYAFFKNLLLCKKCTQSMLECYNILDRLGGNSTDNYLIKFMAETPN